MTGRATSLQTVFKLRRLQISNLGAARWLQYSAIAGWKAGSTTFSPSTLNFQPSTPEVGHA